MFPFINHSPAHDPSGIRGRVTYLFLLWRLADRSAQPNPGADTPAPFAGKHTQQRVVQLLDMNKDGLPQKQLAYLLGIRSQSLAEVVRKLEDAGYITREPNPNDRRSSIITLTGQGIAAAAAQRDAMNGHDSPDPHDSGLPAGSPADALTDSEQDTLSELLDKLIAHTEQAVNQAGGNDPRLARFKSILIDGADPRAADPSSRGGFPGGFPEGFPGGLGAGDMREWGAFARQFFGRRGHRRF